MTPDPVDNPSGRRREKALLVQPHAPGSQDPGLLEEFVELARSAGADVVGTILARIERPSASHYLGSGKVEELRAACAASEADLVLVNHSLSPVQERNLSKDLGRRVVDRTGLILDIFAQRAVSHEGKLQVELAQLGHVAARLVHGRSGLDSQRGGSIGLRGPGETRLELDRRLLQKRREQLQARLEKVEVQRTQMRRARIRNAMPKVALIGYTNAGKSTLFNALTGAGVYAADRLFATLDPTVRRLAGAATPVALSDTVGFVRDLPHDLVAAFRSTLSEAREADLLLHVVDAADPQADERIAQVNAVLAEIGAGDIPQWRVYNKIDLLASGLAAKAPATFWVSAKSGEGLDSLRQALATQLGEGRIRAKLQLAPAQGRLRARLHALGAVAGESADEHGWALQLDLPEPVLRRLASEFSDESLQALLLVAPVAPTYNPHTP